MISTETQRILYKSNAAASLVDASDDLNNFRTGSVSITLDTDGYIYIGQWLPFVSRYFDLGTTKNTVAAALKVEIWDGTIWRNTVDFRDRTKATGITLGQSGYLNWRIDRDEQVWQCEDESQDIVGLETGPQIYDFYWLRLSTDTLLTATDISFVGNLFSTDAELYSHYPALNDQTTKDQWDRLNPGVKTDWKEQGFMAAEFIVRDLKTRNIIVEDGQIFDAAKFNMCSIHKQANMIYGGLGRGYQDQQDRTEKAYQDSMNLGRLNIDSDADGRLRGRERMIRTEFATR